MIKLKIRESQGVYNINVNIDNMYNMNNDNRDNVYNKNNR